MRSCMKEIKGRIEFAVEYKGKTAKDVDILNLECTRELTLLLSGSHEDGRGYGAKVLFPRLAVSYANVGFMEGVKGSSSSIRFPNIS